MRVWRIYRRRSYRVAENFRQPHEYLVSLEKFRFHFGLIWLNAGIPVRKFDVLHLLQRKWCVCEMMMRNIVIIFVVAAAVVCSKISTSFRHEQLNDRNTFYLASIKSYLI